MCGLCSREAFERGDSRDRETRAGLAFVFLIISLSVSISARPSYQGVRRSVWDPETIAQGGRTSPAARRAVSKERLGDWDGQMDV